MSDIDRIMKRANDMLKDAQQKLDDQTKRIDAQMQNINSKYTTNSYVQSYNDDYINDWRTLFNAYKTCSEYYIQIGDINKAQACADMLKNISNSMSSNNSITDSMFDDNLLKPIGGSAAIKAQMTSTSTTIGGSPYGGGITMPKPQIPDPFGIEGIYQPKTTPNTNPKINTDNQNDSNPYNFTLKDLTEEDKLEDFIKADLPVFLHGKSGCGKSARVKEIDPNCEIIYLAAAKPETLNGKSIVVDGELKDVPPEWYINLCKKCEEEPDKDHILFFDEITNATPAIQGFAFNIILDKKVNGKWKLPDNVKVVAAGNEDKESLSANKLSEPLFRRFNHIYIETTLNDWLLWASKHNIHPAIYAYVASKGDGREQVLRTECNNKEPCTDPRKWEMASKLLYKTNNPKALTATIGKQLTEDFIRFCKMPVITLEQVLNGNYDQNMGRLSIDEGYATLIGLAACSDNDIKIVRKFVKKYVIADQYQNFVMMWTRGDQNRIDKLRELDLLEKEEAKGNVR